MDHSNPDPAPQHIFVSYSRDDSEIVDAIVSRLNVDGYNVWLDRADIKGGDVWSVEIVKAVGDAYIFLLMLSSSAATSKNVRQEVYLAFEKDKDLVPIKLEPVEIPDALQYQLAGRQWIEYYRNPDEKYAELVNVLSRRKPGPAPTMLAVAFILRGLNISGAEKQARLLDAIANFTGAPRTAFEITEPLDTSGHIVVKMPADAAYRLQTAALNCDTRLINYGIKGLRLTGDRNFVWVKSGRFAPLESGKWSGRWWKLGSALFIALIIAFLFIFPIGSPGLPPTAPPQPVTNAYTLTSSSTPTGTPTSTASPSRTPTNTASVTSTSSPIEIAYSIGTPQLSTDRLYFPGESCNPNEITIQVSASHSAGIRVLVFFHAVREVGSETDPDWSDGIAMTPLGGGFYTLSISGDGLIGDSEVTRQAEILYQFVIQPTIGDWERSTVYRDLSLLPCNSTSTPTLFPGTSTSTP